jgi:hypothetical protein
VITRNQSTAFAKSSTALVELWVVSGEAVRAAVDCQDQDKVDDQGAKRGTELIKIEFNGSLNSLPAPLVVTARGSYSYVYGKILQAKVFVVRRLRAIEKNASTRRNP